MSAVNPINDESRLPEQIFKPAFNFHEGPISKQETLEYVPKFLDEYHAVDKLIYSKENISKWYQENVELKLKEVMKEENKTSWYGILWLYAVTNVPLENTDWLITWFGISITRTLSEILQVQTWSFIIATSMQIWPLWLTTVFSMLTPQDFTYESCNTLINVTATDVTMDSFNAACGYLPMAMYSHDYPHRPALSSVQDPSTNCTGIASGISNKSYFDSALVQQYIIYAALGLFTVYLSKKEVSEKLYVRIALHLDGVFHPCEDRSRLHSPTSYMRKYPFLQRLEPFFNSWFVMFLVAWYFWTISYIPPSTQTYYIFPSSDEQIVFINENDPPYSGWCNLLDFPVKLTYIKYENSSFVSRLLAAWVFFCTARGLISSQKLVYDWIDTDAYMDDEAKDSCSFYNVHNNRPRNFNELMLNDWITANIYPLLLDKLKGKKGFNAPETIAAYEAILKDIDNINCPHKFTDHEL